MNLAPVSSDNFPSLVFLQGENTLVNQHRAHKRVSSQKSTKLLIRSCLQII